MNSTIDRKMNHCVVCGKPSGTWKNCINCRAKIYRDRSIKKREMNGAAQQDDEKFYQHTWKHSLHYCAECGAALKEFNRWWVHHILSKSKYPAYRHDSRNIILLCYQHHNEAESSISYPKLKIFEYCEMMKRLLLAESGIEYNPKITTP